MESDADFKKAHPVGYVFLVLLGILAFMGPPILYAIFGLSKFPNANGWFIVGFVGAFCIGIGLFNFVAIIIKQYLGHIVSIVLFLIGGILAVYGKKIPQNACKINFYGKTKDGTDPSFVFWSECRDLNPRPLDPQSHKGSFI